MRSRIAIMLVTLKTKLHDTLDFAIKKRHLDCNRKYHGLRQLGLINVVSNWVLLLNLTALTD